MTQNSLTLDFSLILPLYNEGATLANNLERIYNILQIGKFSFEIILIDDCSQDASVSVARQFASRHPEVAVFVHEKNQGRGGTVMDGFATARGTVIGYMDVDCEVSPVYLLEFITDLIAKRHDIITGFRVYKFSLSSILRVMASLWYRLIMRRTLGLKLQDTESGYKIFRKEAYQRISDYLENRGWFWDTEVMAVATLAGLSIEERKVLFVRDHEKRSTVRLFRDSIVYIRTLLAFRKRYQKLMHQIK